MEEDFYCFKSIGTGPIIKDKKIIGHEFREDETTYYGMEDEEGMSTSSTWFFYPNGEYSCTTQRSWEFWDIPEDGTFDCSKYDEFVEQMMDGRTDWKKELKRNPWDYELDEPIESKIDEPIESKKGDGGEEMVIDELPF